ncbi:phage portal protein [Candidatus Bathyarchaeota archaeon]|nr:phage portal protein [Candidatus Bathyarchaeota archaeon]
MSLIGRLWEKLRETAAPKGIVQTALSIFRYEARKGASLEELEKYYLTDPVAHAAVDLYVELTVGGGYYTTAEDQRAKELVDGFAETVNMDELLREAVRNMLIYGDAYVEKVYRKPDGRLVGLNLLPSKTVRVERDRHGRVLRFVQRDGATSVSFKPEEILHLKHNPVGNSAYGTSMLTPVLGFLKAKRKAVENMEKILSRYAAPKVIWRAPNRNALQQLQAVLETLRPDEDIILTGEVDFKPLTVDPRARFEFFYEYLDRQVFEGLQAPLLSWLRNATEASARTMLETVERRVMGIQRYLKRKVEAEVFKPLVETEGLKEVPRLNWGSPKSRLEDVSLADVGGLVKSGILDPSEARRWLAKLGFPLEV